MGHIKFEVPLKSFSGNVKELIGYIGQEHKKHSNLEKHTWVFSKEIGLNKFT